MKQLLILAYDFPPYVSVGGLRPYAWYKYLKEFGVYPIVVTRQWGNKYGSELDYIAPGESPETIVEETDCGTIIRTPYKPNLANRLMLKYGKNRFALLRKTVTAFYEIAQFVFFVGPKAGIWRGAKNYLKNSKVDAVIATGEPFILFRYASVLGKRFSIPWIADYRDPWTQNKNRALCIMRHFERKIVNRANAVTTVSEFFKSKIGENVSEPIYYILPNGYNPDSIKQVEHIEQNSDALRIALAGTISNWHPYKSVLEVFTDFVKTNTTGVRLELNFFGINRHEEIEKFIQEHSLQEHIHVYQRMDNAALLKNLRQHNAMLLFNDYSYIGTKIYDYLAIKRLILLCYSNDEEAQRLKADFYPYSLSNDKNLSDHLQEDCLRETNSGIVVKDSQHLRQVLTDLCKEFTENKCIACNSHNIEQFSRREQTRLVAEIVKEKLA